MNALETNIVTNLQSNLGVNKGKAPKMATVTADATEDSIISKKQVTLTVTANNEISSLTTPESTAHDSVADVKTIVKSATPSVHETGLSLNILPEIHAPKKNEKPKEKATPGSLQDSAVKSVKSATPSRKIRSKKVSPEKQTVSTSSLTRKQQKDLLDEILRYTRTKEMVTPSFFSDADSKEA